MLSTRLLSTAFVAALAVPLASSCTTADATLLVVNESDFVIIEINLTETDNPDWGPNLLRGDVLLPGEELLLGVDCDFYDARLIDEDNVVCEIYDLDLCLNDADWIIRNNTCSVFNAKQQQEQGTASPTSATELAK